VPLITVMTPCYNEEGNVVDLHESVQQVFSTVVGYEYEHVFIDNASTDGTQARLREMAAKDRRVKVILNSRNFGVIRSSYHGFLQCDGDAVIPMAADFQDPPDLIPEFIQKWEEGYEVVLAVKSSSGESKIMYAVRRLYYNIVNRLSEVQLIDNFHGYGLYDRKIVNALREMDDPYPYVRGLIAEAGFRRAEVNYRQPPRKRGKSSYNFYRLYDMAMLGITSHSKVPLRLATMLGFAMSVLSFLVGTGYLAAKLIFWDYFTLGIAPILIAVFFFGSVQLFFTGILGEYIGFIYTHVRHLPLVFERERINFDSGPGSEGERADPLPEGPPRERA
jgi:polyisoprenyl-phosphate glycosyltransferase